MNILISGAGGFIGKNLLQHLQQRHEIFALDISPLPQNDNPSIHWIQHDLTRDLQTSGLPKNIDAVIHLAQSRHYRQFPEKAEDIYRVNINSTFNLLEYARQAGAGHFILASTGGVYRSSPGALNENSTINPSNFYATSKYTAELLVRSYSSFFQTTIFRFFFVYGPGQKSMLIPGLMEKVMSGETIQIDGKPGLMINPTFVGDAVRAFEPALQLNKNHTINIAGDEIVSISDVVQKIETVCNRTADMAYSDALPGRLVADNRKMKSILNIHPQSTLDEGLKLMFEQDFSAH